MSLLCFGLMEGWSRINQSCSVIPWPGQRFVSWCFSYTWQKNFQIHAFQGVREFCLSSSLPRGWSFALGVEQVWGSSVEPLSWNPVLVSVPWKWSTEFHSAPCIQRWYRLDIVLSGPFEAGKGKEMESVMPFSATSLGWQCLSRRDAGRALAFHGLLELCCSQPYQVSHCLGCSQQCLQAVVHPLLQGQGLSKERDKRARLCTHWMSTILGRSQSEVVDLNTKGVIIFGAKNRALTLKLWW